MRTGDVLECVGRRWRAERTIGAGHTAAVWLLVPEDGSSDARLVAKCIRPPRPGSVGRGMSPSDFVAETGTLHRLLAAEGPVPRARSRFPWVYACDVERRHFVMEHVSGVALRDIVGVRLLTIEQILALAIQLTEALAATVRAGLRNTDLKLDAVLWDAEAERLVILDWNVCRERRPADDAGWLSPELAFVAAVLDGVLQHASQGVADGLPDWSRPFDRAPKRWGSYLRVFQRVFTGLAEQPEARTLDALRARLVAIADALARQPEALLSAVKQQVAHARTAPRTHRAELAEAAAFAELAVAARRHAVALRARLLMGEALELLGPTAASLETLRATAMGAGDDALVAPGEGVVLHRLRRFARVRVAALGIGRPLTEALEACEDQQWRVAADRLQALLQRFAHNADLAADLRPLLDESRGLAACLEGLRALDEADRLGLDTPRGETSLTALDELERRRALLVRGVADLERGLTILRTVPWSTALMGMLAQLPRLLAYAREAVGPAAAPNAPPSHAIGSGPAEAAAGSDSGQPTAEAPEDGHFRAPSSPAHPADPAERRVVDEPRAADHARASAARGTASAGPRARPPSTAPRGRPAGKRPVDASGQGATGRARRDIRQPRPLPRAAMAREAAGDRLTLVDVPSARVSSQPVAVGFTEDMAADFDLDAQTEVFVPPRSGDARAGVHAAPEVPVPEPPEPPDEPEKARSGDRALIWVMLAAMAVGAGGIWWATRPDGAGSGTPPGVPVVTVQQHGPTRGASVAVPVDADVEPPSAAVEDATLADGQVDAQVDPEPGVDGGVARRARASRARARSKRRASRVRPRPARPEPVSARPARPRSPGGVQDEDRPDAPVGGPTAARTSVVGKTPQKQMPPGETGAAQGSGTPSPSPEDRPGGQRPAGQPLPVGVEPTPSAAAGGGESAPAGSPPDAVARDDAERGDDPADAGAPAAPTKRAPTPRPGPARPSETTPTVDERF